MFAADRTTAKGGKFRLDSKKRFLTTKIAENRDILPCLAREHQLHITQTHAKNFAGSLLRAGG